MNCLAWNCRGLGNPRAVRCLGELLKTHKPTVVFLIETLVDKNRMEGLRRKFGYDSCFAVDVRGRSGGLAAMWKNNDLVDIQSYSDHHIEMQINDQAVGSWRLIGFYGFADRARHDESWSLLRQIDGNSILPWAVIGDFNCILNSEEKVGGAMYPANLRQNFVDTISALELYELHMRGSNFTWDRGKGTDHWIREKLDRCFGSDGWINRFPNYRLTNLVAGYSDHSPLLLEVVVRSRKVANRRFRFEQAWLLEEDFGRLVRNKWQAAGPDSVINKLFQCSSSMEGWGKDFRRRFARDISASKNKLRQLADAMDPESVALYFETRSRLNQLLEQEEIYWKQRAKAFWLKEGDRNSKFFHASVSARKKANYISKIVDEQGVEHTDGTEMGESAVTYFESLFEPSMLNSYDTVEVLPILVDEGMNGLLTAPFSIEEFRTAMFQMHPEKSPGPDGLNPGFYQHFWPEIGGEIFQACVGWLERKEFPANLNDTIIVLIPKVENPTRMTELRPISLCNVLYKLIAKVLANRLKSCLPSIVSETQSAFVPGRSLIDSVQIAFESIHYMNRNNSVGDGEVALKIDISKAYDRVDWGFLQAVLQRMGFHKTWIQWIMLCVTTVSYSVSVNGTLVGPITPGRGLRQGDPISPYLFILCAEVLSRLIAKAEEEGRVHGCQVCNGAPSVTHLFFADDSFLFFRATLEECQVIGSILKCYEEASGQSVNLNKSGIFFSLNVEDAVKDAITDELHVYSALDTGRYLGLPSLIGREKVSLFSFLKDRLRQRFNSWSHRFLSSAGKDVLLKSVAQTLPTFCMSTFLIPKSLCDDLEKMMNSFWWGMKSGGRRGMHWTNWSKLCKQKNRGGLGFRDLRKFNLSLLAKQGWKLLNSPNMLVSRLFKAKYFCNRTFLSSKLGNNPSMVWRSVWNSIDVLKKGLRWRIGRGDMVSVWQDPWVINDLSFRISSACPPEAATAKVQDLFIPNTRVWDRGKVERWFNVQEAELILDMVIPTTNRDDKMIWHFTKDGCYSSKSGYRALEDHEMDPSQGLHNMWSLAIPPKVRFFIWKFVSRNLPMRSRLRERHVNVPPTCVFCPSDLEYSWHLFAGCPIAQRCWVASGMSAPRPEWDYVEDAFLDDCLNLSNGEASRRAVVLWTIWNLRNSKVWEAKNENPEVAVASSLRFLAAWRAAKEKGRLAVSSTSVQGAAVWCGPAEGFLKCNVDAALFGPEKQFGVGAVVRDNQGQFLCSCSAFEGGVPSSSLAEAMALRHAMMRVFSRGMDRVVFEIDAQVVVRSIAAADEDLSDYGGVIQDIKELLQSHINCLVQFVPRIANGVAHLLARNARSNPNPFIAFTAPDFIKSALCRDIGSTD